MGLAHTPPKLFLAAPRSANYAPGGPTPTGQDRSVRYAPGVPIPGVTGTVLGVATSSLAGSRPSSSSRRVMDRHVTDDRDHAKNVPAEILLRRCAYGRRPMFARTGVRNESYRGTPVPQKERRLR